MKLIALIISITATLTLYAAAADVSECVSPTPVIGLDDPCPPQSFGGTPQTPEPPRYAFEKYHWHEYARYVQSHTNVWLKDDGTWRIETKFSNGNRLAKQTMGISVAVITGQEECLFGAVHEVNLDPSFGGSANEYISTSTGSIPKDEVSLAADTMFTASVVTSHVIDRFNNMKPYGQDLPNGERRAC